MRIQTRLFLGTAALVLTLTGIQWLLYARQLRSIEEDLTNVAATVGRGVLSAEIALLTGANGTIRNEVWVSADHSAVDAKSLPSPSQPGIDKNVHVMVLPEAAEAGVPVVDRKTIVRRHPGSGDEGVVEETFEWVFETSGEEGDSDTIEEFVLQDFESAREGRLNTRKLVLKVEDGEKVEERFLVVSEDDRHLHRIPIPVSPTVTRIRETMQRGAAVGGVLLVAGLLASAVLSSRVTRPLRSLADGADLLGRGDLGIQVPESASGEVGDLQRAFNRMSHRLQELEEERKVWQQREHLAQLGDLSRGLAHTLRNPLHTLGLAVEELADGDTARPDLVETSRAQIRRIDRWLRSFLALGAEESVEPEEIVLDELVNGIVLESVQQGSDVRVEGEKEIRVRAVPGALRAAIGNLIENATQASPAGEPVEIAIGSDGACAVVRIADRGSGLPPEVRERLFSPHVTTKVGGSGMGLFLAQQLIVGTHGGELEVADGAGRGTVATIRLPLTGAGDGEDGLG